MDGSSLPEQIYMGNGFIPGFYSLMVSFHGLVNPRKDNSTSSDCLDIMARFTIF
jgi:hypothetical protein